MADQVRSDLSEIHESDLYTGDDRVENFSRYLYSQKSEFQQIKAKRSSRIYFIDAKSVTWSRHLGCQIGLLCPAQNV